MLKDINQWLPPLLYMASLVGNHKVTEYLQGREEMEAKAHKKNGGGIGEKMNELNREWCLQKPLL